MSLQGSDLVQDSQLQVKILEDRTIHYVRDKSSTERLAIIEQTWHRVRKVGHGGFGVVWLESCTSGNAKKIRAVKELKTVKENGSHVNYIRELEAVAKFSHEKVFKATVRMPKSGSCNLSTTISSFNHTAGMLPSSPSSSQWNILSMGTCNSIFGRLP